MSVDEATTPVECHDADTGEFYGWYPNLSALAKAIGLNESRIRYVCQGKRQTTANLTFKFVSSLDPKTPDEERDAMVEKILLAMARPNPRYYPQLGTAIGRTETSRNRSRQRTLTSSRASEVVIPAEPNPQGAADVPTMAKEIQGPPPQQDRSGALFKPMKVTIDPSHPIFQELVGYVTREVAPSLLKRGSMCKAVLNYPGDLWLPHSQSNPIAEDSEGGKNRRFFRPVCVVDKAPSCCPEEPFSAANFFLPAGAKRSAADASFVVFDGVRLYKIPFSQLVLPVEDGLLFFLSKQCIENVDEFPAIVNREVTKWIDRQWTTDEVAAYANTVSHFSTEEGHVELSLLYAKNRVLSNRAYSEVVDFHYNYPVFARLNRAKVQVKYCQSATEKARCLSRVQVLEREKSHLLKMIRCSTLLRKSPNALAMPLFTVVNYLYRERLVSVDVTRTDKLITVDHLPYDDVDDVLHRYDASEAFDSMDDEITQPPLRGRLRPADDSDEQDDDRSATQRLDRSQRSDRKLRRLQESNDGSSSDSDLESLSSMAAASAEDNGDDRADASRAVASRGADVDDDEGDDDDDETSDVKASTGGYQPTTSEATARGPKGKIPKGFGTQNGSAELVHSSVIRYASQSVEEIKKTAVACRAVVQIDMLSGQPIRLFKSINCVCRFLNIRCSSSIRKSIQSGKPSYGAFIWRDYDGPEVDCT